MKKSEMHMAQGEPQFDGEKAEALTSLTPEQLESVAGGFASGFGFVSDVIGLLRLLFRV